MTPAAIQGAYLLGVRWAAEGRSGLPPTVNHPDRRAFLSGWRGLPEPQPENCR